MESRDTFVMNVRSLVERTQHLVAIRMNVKKRYSEPMKNVVQVGINNEGACIAVLSFVSASRLLRYFRICVVVV